MTKSNSKLTPAEKIILKDLRDEQAGTLMYRNFDTTMIAEISGNVARFATSVRSVYETKNRNKVGEYHARSRFCNGEIAILNSGDFLMLLETLDFEKIVK